MSGEVRRPVFGQIVMGAAGAGKTTFCNGMQHLISLQSQSESERDGEPPSMPGSAQNGSRRSQRRVAKVINLDPMVSSEECAYDCSIDVRDLVDGSNVQEELGLGPNGAILFCMEYLEKNLDWLEDRICQITHQNTTGNGGANGHATHGGDDNNNKEEEVEEEAYLIFDCPGQIELFSMHGSFRSILLHLQRRFDLRICAVNLVDATIACSDGGNYIAAALVSLSVMLHLELPHVNVLAKADLARQIAVGHGADGESESAQILRRMLDDDDGDNGDTLGCIAAGELVDAMMEESHTKMFSAKREKLTRGLCEVIDDFALVNFLPVAIEDGPSVQRILDRIDKAIGYTL